MKTIYLATHNEGKVEEFKKILHPIMCLRGPQNWPSPEEDGATYRENAEKKAKSLFEVVQQPVLSDDSGIEIDCLGGNPGVHSAYFGGALISWPQRWRYVHAQLKPFPTSQWTARFRCVLCYMDQNGPKFFEGITEGRILESPVGENGFGYDPIFYSTELKKGFAEASSDEKHLASHRGKAAQAFLAWISRRGA